MHALSSYRGNSPTNTQTDRGDYNTLRRSLARSVIIMANSNPTLTGDVIHQLGRFGQLSEFTWLRHGQSVRSARTRYACLTNWIDSPKLVQLDVDVVRHGTSVLHAVCQSYVYCNISSHRHFAQAALCQLTYCHYRANDVMFSSAFVCLCVCLFDC